MRKAISMQGGGLPGNVRRLLLSFLMVGVLLGVSSFLYYGHMKQTVINESSSYLQEISRQIGANINRTLENNFSVLSTMSSALRVSQADTFDTAKPIVLTERNDWNYEHILYIDESGIAFDETGNRVTIQMDKDLRRTIVGRERTISTSQTIDNNENLLFAIPVDGLTISGIEVSALAATYQLSTFDKILAMTTFDGQGYCSINQRDGTVIVRPSLPSAIQMGFNTLATLQNAELDDGGDLSLVTAEIRQGISGMVGFTLEGQHIYMAYTPISNNDWSLLTFVPVEVVSKKSYVMLRLTLLLCGGIVVVFVALFSALMLSYYRHRRELENIAYVDPITGGNTIQRFYALAREYLQRRPEGAQYAIIYGNIEKFKIINEQCGRDACDLLLQHIYKSVENDLSEQECVGRLYADNFCILVHYWNRESTYERLRRWYDEAARQQEDAGAAWVAPVLECGVFVIDDDKMPFSMMIDRAKLCLRETQHEVHGKLRCAIYDDEMRRRVFREKKLEDMMDSSLQNGEFQVFLQPKYLTSTERIGGAEALIRWKSTAEGMIFPDEFIPLFEKNGTISTLDLFVFEQTCITVRKWLDCGLTPIKISVNCSRVHLRDPHFLNRYLAIARKHNVSTAHFEIELTENVVFGDVKHLSKTIDDIHAAGFGCSMDDFGSGYSSLNLIQDIPVDTIKLDKVFFHNSMSDGDRTESVVGSILTMTKALNMETVAEGVEERTQVEMLKRLGCDYIQGYYFAKPMPIAEFEQLAFGREVH